jgi:hypothetical protein
MINFFGKALNRKISLLMLLLIGAFCYGLWVKAQQDPRVGQGLQVSPVRYDWDMKSGDERTGVINLKNYDDISYDIEISAEDFYVTDDTSEAKFFVPGDGHPLKAYDVINWIEKPATIFLAPGENKDVIFKVKVPIDAPTGGYYGALFFKTGPQKNGDEQNQSSSIGINQRVGVLLVMAVKGSQPIIRNGKLQKFSPAQNIFWDKPASLEAEVANTGNLHYMASGQMDIYKFGRKVSTFPLDARILYPGKYRKYESQWDFSPWAYGYYKAGIDLISDDGAIRIVGQTSFWVIPWKTTLGIILILIIIWQIYRIFGNKFEIRRKGAEEEDFSENEQA